MNAWWIVLGSSRCAVAAIWIYNRLVSLRTRGQRVVRRSMCQLSPRRPDPEPGRDRQGLRDAGVSSSSTSPGEGAVDQGHRRVGPGRRRDQVTGLRQLLAVVENYPDLKANENFLALQEELVATESKIAYAASSTTTR